MYRELAIYGNDCTDEFVKQQIFIAAKHRLGGISTSSYYIPKVKDLIPEGMVISSVVNFPDGIDDFKVIQHSIISILRKGANAIDLVLNPNYIVNNKLKNFMNEIPCYMKICSEYGATLRTMMEYRTLDTDTIMNVVDILVDMQVEYIFPSTGRFVDDFDDNLTISSLISQKYSKLNVISTAPIWKIEQYERIQQSKLFGLRLYNTSILERLGV